MSTISEKNSTNHPVRRTALLDVPVDGLLDLVAAEERVEESHDGLVTMVQRTLVPRRRRKS